MSLGWTIVFLVVDIIATFSNYLNYYLYIDRSDLDKTRSQEIFRMGYAGGVIGAIMFILVMYLFKLTGLTI